MTSKIALHGRRVGGVSERGRGGERDRKDGHYLSLLGKIGVLKSKEASWWLDFSLYREGHSLRLLKVVTVRPRTVPRV